METKRSCATGAALAAIALQLFSLAARAHPDIELQIERLTREIGERPDSAELYLERGDLHRRHADWSRAAGDFETARAREPAHPLLDWYEGRLKCESGQRAEGVVLLTRFLEKRPGHAGAYRVRALAVWRMGDARAAARDFALAISSSEKPAPSLYRSLVLAQARFTAPQYREALVSVDEGLARFPAEIALLGLGVDLALAAGEPPRAAAYLDRLRPGLQTLPQWTYRRALHSCLVGDTEAAMDLLGALSREPARAGTWAVPRETVTRLSAGLDSAACRAAATAMLEGTSP